MSTSIEAQGHTVDEAIQIASKISRAQTGDVDLLVAEGEKAESISRRLLNVLIDVRKGVREPRSLALGNTGSQITRGFNGISL